MEVDERNGVSMAGSKLRKPYRLPDNLGLPNSEHRPQMHPSAGSLKSKWRAKMKAFLGWLLQGARWQSLDLLAKTIRLQAGAG